MPRFRLSGLAQADLAGILATSDENWGAAGRTRYAATIAAAMQQIAADPNGPTTRDRSLLSPGIRSFHLRHVVIAVRRPVHVLYYRLAAPDLVEIVRVLHESMEPSRHLGASTDTEKPP